MESDDNCRVYNFPGSLKIKGEDVPPINDGAWDGRWAVILPEPSDPGE